MNVIIDTSVWSKALRQHPQNKDIEFIRSEISELINESRVVVLGIILQEILSGVKTANQFLELQEHFSSFNIEIQKREYFVKAADFFNQCRKKGIQGSHIDFYICAVANINNWQIYTFDNDFNNYSKIINIEMYKCRYE